MRCPSRLTLVKSISDPSVFSDQKEHFVEPTQKNPPQATHLIPPLEIIYLEKSQFKSFVSEEEKKKKKRVLSFSLSKQEVLPD